MDGGGGGIEYRTSGQLNARSSSKAVKWEKEKGRIWQKVYPQLADSLKAPALSNIHKEETGAVNFEQVTCFAWAPNWLSSSLTQRYNYKRLGTLNFIQLA